MRRPRKHLLALLLLVPMLAGSAASSSAATPESEEFSFLQSTNDARAAAGLAPLKMSTSLVEYARSHSARMLQAGTIFHTEDLAVVANERVPRWQRAGENVGVGGSVDSLHNALMNSPGHRANILGDYNYVGMGVVQGSGRMYITQFFAKTPADLAVSNGPNVSPLGSFDVIRRELDLASVAGWAIDPDTAAPIDIHVYVDGRFSGNGTADVTRSDIGGAYPDYGSQHGFSFNIQPGPGSHNVCAYAINTGPGTNTLLGCRTLDMNPTPFGSLDNVQRVAGGVSVNGWAIDPDTSSSVDVHVYADGAFAGAGRASMARSDLAYGFPDYGGSHGFGVTVALGAGTHDVCVYALNLAGAGNNALLGCRSITLDANSFGSLDVAQATTGGIRVSGWAIDPDTASAINVHVYVDSSFAGSFPAKNRRDDLAAFFPSWGAGHGYEATVSASPGSHVVCAYAIDAAGGGTNTGLGCRVT